GHLRRVQVVSCRDDRVVRAHDVAGAVDPPGRGQELHRSQGAGAGGPVDAAEVRLDVVDGREVGPVDAVERRGRRVVRAEGVDGLRDEEVAAPVNPDTAEVVDAGELPEGPDRQAGVREAGATVA